LINSYIKNPFYVINIDAKNNNIIVGPKESLLIKHLDLRDVNLLCEKNELEKDE